MCSSPVVYAPTEEFPHGSIEQNSLGDSIVSPCYSRSIKTKDRKPLLIEGKRSKEVEKKFFQKRDFPLPGSHQHEQVRNKLRKYIHKTFMKNEQVQCSDTDEKGTYVCVRVIETIRLLPSVSLTGVLLSCSDPLPCHF